MHTVPLGPPIWWASCLTSPAETQCPCSSSWTIANLWRSPPGRRTRCRLHTLSAWDFLRRIAFVRPNQRFFIGSLEKFSGPVTTTTRSPACWPRQLPRGPGPPSRFLVHRCQRRRPETAVRDGGATRRCRGARSRNMPLWGRCSLSGRTLLPRQRRHPRRASARAPTKGSQSQDCALVVWGARTRRGCDSRWS
jgi:hypothetical protein